MKGDLYGDLYGGARSCTKAEETEALFKKMKDKKMSATRSQNEAERCNGRKMTG